MKLKLLAGAALVGVFAAPGAFAAPADTGWYGAIDIGAHFMQPLTTTSAVTEDANGPYRFKFGNGTNFAGFARIGYKVSPHLRVELEGGYRPGGIKVGERHQLRLAADSRNLRDRRARRHLPQAQRFDRYLEPDGQPLPRLPA